METKQIPAILLMVLLIVLPACSVAAESAESFPDGGSRVMLWYAVNDGRLTKIGGPGSAPPRTFLPWTVQQRVAAVAAVDRELYVGVNSFGLARLTWAKSESGGIAPSISYLYRPDTFRYRTIARLVPVNGSLVCHLYFNVLLNTTDRKQLSGGSVNLIVFDRHKGADRSRVLRPPFQAEHSDWELVSLIPEDDQGLFAMEWKRSDDRSTDFRHLRYNL